MSGDATRCPEADDECDVLVESNDSNDRDVRDPDARDRDSGDGERSTDPESADRAPADRASAAPATADPATVRREIRRRAEAVRRHERDRALERLAAAGHLTDDQRRAVDALSSALADGIVDRADALLRDGEIVGLESDGDPGEDGVGADGGRSEDDAETGRDRRATAAALRELFLSDA